MLQMQDLGAFKDIPGYTAITRAVLKSLIQGLVEQLSEHTGEESVILTASVSDGTLCFLGSNSGKDFLEGRDEIKSQFLKHCLKKHHCKSTQPAEPPDIPKSRRTTFEGGIPSTESSAGMAIKEKSPKPTFHPYARQKKGRTTQLSYDNQISANTSGTTPGDYQSETSGDGFTSFGLADGSILKIQATAASNTATETGSNYDDQEDNGDDEMTEAQSGGSMLVKQDPDSDMSITGMVPSSQAEYTEGWAAGYAGQGTSDFSDEALQAQYDSVRDKVIGQPLDHTYQRQIKTEPSDTDKSPPSSVQDNKTNEFMGSNKKALVSTISIKKEQEESSDRSPLSFAFTDSNKNGLVPSIPIERESDQEPSDRSSSPSDHGITDSNKSGLVPSISLEKGPEEPSVRSQSTLTSTISNKNSLIPSISIEQEPDQEPSDRSLLSSIQDHGLMDSNKNCSLPMISIKFEPEKNNSDRSRLPSVQGHGFTDSNTKCSVPTINIKSEPEEHNDHHEKLTPSQVKRFYCMYCPMSFSHQSDCNNHVEMDCEERPSEEEEESDD